MNSDDEIYKYQPLWGNWYIEIPIGKGSFGSVYRISREEMGRKYISAVKFITVPSDEQRKEAETSLGDDEDTLNEYFGDIVRNIVGEIDMLYALSGNSNIISYQDHEVRKRQQGVGWDILIRMEYVTSLRKYLKEYSMTMEEVIRLGIDICTALETCSKKGIIHRDIKDDNIFVSDDGVFKLGDFGIARELSKSGRAASMRGTPLYMAPEIFRGEKYDASVDIYSLGIVLYKLLNFGRMPLMPPYPEKVSYQDSEDALEKRMSGAELPPPSMAGGKLSSIVLKACAFSAEGRYSSPTDMKYELEKTLTLMIEPERNYEIQAVTERTSVKEIKNEEATPEELHQTQAEATISSTLGIYLDLSDSETIDHEQKKIDGTIGVFTEVEKQTEAQPDPEPESIQKSPRVHDEESQLLSGTEWAAIFFILLFVVLVAFGTSNCG